MSNYHGPNLDDLRKERSGERMTPHEFYQALATNVVNVPRPGHPEDASGLAGVARASEAQFFAKDVIVMTLWDALDLARKYAEYCANL